jgi:Transposase IS66 family
MRPTQAKATRRMPQVLNAVSEQPLSRRGCKQDRRRAPRARAATRSPDGSAAPAGGSRRCTSACATTCSPGIICSPTTPRCRCSIPDVGGRRPAGVDRSRQRRFICSRQTAELSDQLRIWRTSKACSTSTAMLASSTCKQSRRRARSMLEPYTATVLRGGAGQQRSDRDRNASPDCPTLRRRSRGSRSIACAPARGTPKPFEAHYRWHAALVRSAASACARPQHLGGSDPVRALSRWDGLTRFLHDGRIELDTNPVERAIRPVVRIISSPAATAVDIGGPCSVR